VLQSQSGDFIARGIRQANPVLPEDVRTWLGKYIDELDEKLHPPPKEVAPNELEAQQFDENRGEGETPANNEMNGELTTERSGPLAR
jgi:hypothetical protein